MSDQTLPDTSCVSLASQLSLSTKSTSVMGASCALHGAWVPSKPQMNEGNEAPSEIFGTVWEVTSE